MRIRPLLALVLTAGLCPANAAHAATAKLATRDWVVKHLRTSGVYVAPADLATVVTNANGTVTYSGPASFSDYPEIVRISITVSRTQPTNAAPATNAAPTRALRSGAKALRSTASAASSDFAFYIEGGTFTTRDYKDADFAATDPVNCGFFYQHTVPNPEDYDSDHAHDPDPSDHCYCKEFANVYVESAYESFSDRSFVSLSEGPGPAVPTELMPSDALLSGGWSKPDTWLDSTTWAYVGRRGNQYFPATVAEDGKPSKSYNLTLDELATSSAWDAAVRDAFCDILDQFYLAQLNFASSHTCTDTSQVSHHDTMQTKTCATTWEECPRCHDKTGTESHTDFQFKEGDYSEHWCACAQNHDAHDWSDWTPVDVSNGMATEARVCACGGSQQRQVPFADVSGCHTNDPANVVHVPKSDGNCGCKCGHYGAGGETSTEVQYHAFDANAATPCLCKCGGYHKFVAWTTYDRNQNRDCPGVCAACKTRKAANGVAADATDDDHSPGSAMKCECRCGTVKSGTMSAKFHRRKAGTCRCYGADGNGGAWHFLDADPYCPGVCSKTIGGAKHAAAKNATATVPVYEPTLTAATLDHHTPDAIRCGCKCGEFVCNQIEVASAADAAKWHKPHGNDCGCKGTKNGAYFANKGLKDEPWHVWEAGKCLCKCKNGDHKGIEKTGCTLVCVGGCNGLVFDHRIAATKFNHTPEGTNRCGCVCGDFNGEQYGSAYPEFHAGQGEYPCWCQCGKTHLRFDPSEGGVANCPNACKICDHNYAMTARGVGVHSKSDNCHCECSTKHYMRPGGHQMQESIVHLQEADYVCEVCGNPITVFCRHYECDGWGGHPCDYEFDSPTWEKGHGSGCTKPVDDDPQFLDDGCAGSCGCEHCGCTSCENGEGICATCGKNCATGATSNGEGNPVSSSGDGTGDLGSIGEGVPLYE